MKRLEISSPSLVHLPSPKMGKLILFLFNKIVTRLWTILTEIERSALTPLAVATQIFALQRTTCFHLIEIYLAQISLQCLSDLTVQSCTVFFLGRNPPWIGKWRRGCSVHPGAFRWWWAKHRPLYLHISADRNCAAQVGPWDCCSYTFCPQKCDTNLLHKDCKRIALFFFFFFLLYRRKCSLGVIDTEHDFCSGCK